MGERIARAQEVGIKAWARSVESANRLRNRSAPRVLVYTDSRGLDLGNPYAKTTIGTYVSRLGRRYHLTTVVSPHKHTTLQDFIDYATATSLSSYDAVILHCGIVDFSPRPVGGLEKVYGPKGDRPSFRRMKAENAAYYDAPTAVMFEGEPTINLYSLEYLRSEILPPLATMSNLIWVSSNRFAPGWDGNFSRGRPTNIQEFVSRFDAEVLASLPNTVDLRWWTPSQVRRWTIDNVHFNSDGFAMVALLLDEAISQIIETDHGASASTASESGPGLRTMLA